MDGALVWLDAMTVDLNKSVVTRREVAQIKHMLKMTMMKLHQAQQGE